MPTTKLLLLLLTVLAVRCDDYPPGPTPYCSSRQILPLLPLGIPEVITVDVSNYFSGYNLDIIMPVNNYSYLRPKCNLQASNSTKLDQPVNMELRHSGNSWAKDFVVRH
jgi:hypothetical protein